MKAPLAATFQTEALYAIDYPHMPSPDHQNIVCLYPPAVRTSPIVFAMCLEAEGELEGQTSINELLLTMGEPPVEASLMSVPDDVSSLFPEPPALPGL